MLQRHHEIRGSGFTAQFCARLRAWIETEWMNAWPYVNDAMKGISQCH
jgi:hypothetical protein